MHYHTFPKITASVLGAFCLSLAGASPQVATAAAKTAATTIVVAGSQTASATASAAVPATLVASVPARIPSESFLFAHVNVDALRAVPSVESSIEKIKAMIPQRERRAYEAFKLLTGFNPERDISSATMGFIAVPYYDKYRERERENLVFFSVLRGKFPDQEKIEAFFLEKEGEKKQIGGKPFIVFAKGLFISVLNPDTVVVIIPNYQDTAAPATVATLLLAALSGEGKSLPISRTRLDSSAIAKFWMNISASNAITKDYPRKEFGTPPRWINATLKQESGLLSLHAAGECNSALDVLKVLAMSHWGLGMALREGLVGYTEEAVAPDLGMKRIALRDDIVEILPGIRYNVSGRKLEYFADIPVVWFERFSADVLSLLAAELAADQLRMEQWRREQAERESRAPEKK